MRSGWLAVAAMVACGAAAPAHAQEMWAYCQIERARCVPAGSGCTPDYVWDAPHFFVAPFLTHDGSAPGVDVGAQQALLLLVIQKTGLHNKYPRGGVHEYWKAECPKSNSRAVIEGWADQVRWARGYTEINAREIGR